MVQPTSPFTPALPVVDFDAVPASRAASDASDLWNIGYDLTTQPVGFGGKTVSDQSQQDEEVGLFPNIFVSLGKEAQMEWRKVIEVFDRSAQSKKPLTSADVLRIHGSVAKVTLAADLASKFVAKAAQNLETLLKMQ